MAKKKTSKKKKSTTRRKTSAASSKRDTPEPAVMPAPHDYIIKARYCGRDEQVDSAADLHTALGLAGDHRLYGEGPVTIYAKGQLVATIH